MKKWAMIIDVERCQNCNNCFLSCKDEHVGNDFPGYAAPQPLHGHRWIDIYRKERGQTPMVDHAAMPVMCNHCDDAPCIKAAEKGAMYKRDDGIVLIDPDKARGQRHLVDACPYGAIWWNEELELPQKWIFDAHLLDAGWKEPRCVQACPTGAMQSVKVSDEELQELVQSKQLEVLSPTHNTRPRVFYQNLHLMTQCFIGATLITSTEGRQECVHGASIALVQGDEVLAETDSDVFGEFRFDRLPPDSGVYSLRISRAGLTSRAIETTLVDSQYLGEIDLETVDSASEGASNEGASNTAEAALV